MECNQSGFGGYPKPLPFRLHGLEIAVKSGFQAKSVEMKDKALELVAANNTSGSKAADSFRDLFFSSRPAIFS